MSIQTPLMLTPFSGSKKATISSYNETPENHDESMARLDKRKKLKVDSRSTIGEHVRR